MKLEPGATIRSQGGEAIGEVERIVLDPVNQEVTHIVLERGSLFTNERVIPVPLIERATEEEIHLRIPKDQLGELPPFEESHYVPLNSREWEQVYPGGIRPLYYLHPVLPQMPEPTFPRVPQLPFIEWRVENIPQGTVPIKEGTKVLDMNGETVGEVERVLTDSQRDRATHILLSEGYLFTDHTLVPTAWISEVEEDALRLAVGEGVLEQLPEYEEA